MAFHKQQHVDHRKGGIVNQQFETNLIIPGLQRPPLHQRTQCRGREGHQRHPAVADLQAREHPEGEHAQNRTVGIAGDLVDQIDDAVVGPLLEGQDHAGHPERHRHVDPAADAREACVAIAFRAFEHIHRERGRESREGRPGS